MRFMLAPRSHNFLAKCNNPIVHGIVKVPGSSFFCIKDLVAIVLQCCNLSSSLKVTTLFFVTMSFMNFAYLDIFSKASIKGTLMGSYFNILISLRYLTSSVFFTIICGNNSGGLGIGTTFYVFYASFSITILDFPTNLCHLNILFSININPSKHRLINGLFAPSSGV